MKATFLTLALAAQLAAAGAYAQTTAPTTEGSAGVGSTPGAYGSDWSTTLGPALFGEDGMTLRADSEIATQWATLSEEDKAMIRRDCTMHMQKSGGTTGMTEGTGTATTGTATTGTDTGTTGSTTGTASESTATGTTTGTAADSSTGTTGEGSNDMMTVTDEQMEQICAATKDL